MVRAELIHDLSWLIQNVALLAQVRQRERCLDAHRLVYGASSADIRPSAAEIRFELGWNMAEQCVKAFGRSTWHFWNRFDSANDALIRTA